MKRRHTYSIVIAVGLLTALSSTAALADPSTTTPTPTTTTTTTAPSPPAQEPAPGGFYVSPSSAYPGQTVMVSLNGGSFGCGSLFISSPALIVAQPHEYQTAATVKPDAEPGTYDVSTPCSFHGANNGIVTTTFTVLGDSAPPAGDQVTQIPEGAAQTGGGAAALS